MFCFFKKKHKVSNVNIKQTKKQQKKCMKFKIKDMNTLL